MKIETCIVCGNNLFESTVWGGYIFKGREYCIVRCLKCGFMFLDHLPDLEILNEVYSKDDYFKNYHATNLGLRSYIETMGSYKRLDEQSISLIKNFKSYGKLLDIGCAGGRFLASAKKYGFEVCGIEPNSTMADFAKNELGLNVFCGTLESIDFKADSFDIVYTADVLEHFHDIERSILIIKKIVRKYGILVIQQPLTYNKSFFNLFLKLNMFFKKNKFAENPPLHLWEFNSKTLKMFLEKMGFRVDYYRIFESNAKPLAIYKDVCIKNKLGYLAKKISRAISNSFITKKFELGDRAIAICMNEKRI